MPYMVTFAINIPPMLAYIPYMDPMGYRFNDVLVKSYEMHPRRKRHAFPTSPDALGNLKGLGTRQRCPETTPTTFFSSWIGEISIVYDNIRQWNDLLGNILTGNHGVLHFVFFLFLVSMFLSEILSQIKWLIWIEIAGPPPDKIHVAGALLSRPSILV